MPSLYFLYTEHIGLSMFVFSFYPKTTLKAQDDTLRFFSFSKKSEQTIHQLNPAIHKLEDGEWKKKIFFI